MSFKRDLMIRVMLNNFHQGAPDLILKGLPEGRGRGVLQMEVTSQDALHVLNEPRELAQHVHYSWIAPVIQQFPVNMRPFLLTSLPKGKAVALGELLKTPLHPLKMALPVRLYLIGLISAKLKPAEVLPQPYLPVTTLTPLLSMHKNEIIQLVDYLGVYDLAEEIRHIVDRRYLKAIYNCLSLKKQHFLRLCLNHKERLSVPRLGLDQWRGDCKTLENLMHKRGLIRLGKGISGQHSDFLWHLVHKLDIGRGRLLQEYYDKEEIPGVTQVLIQEIQNLLNFFKKNE